MARMLLSPAAYMIAASLPLRLVLAASCAAEQHGGDSEGVCTNRSPRVPEQQRQLSSEQLLLQLTSAGTLRSQRNKTVGKHEPIVGDDPTWCCSRGCEAYCSPRSGNCYETQAKDYYTSCATTGTSCCGGCSSSGFCSPQSGRCYDTKRKDYYESCGGDETEAGTSCCDECGDDKPFCSPRSGRCYSTKRKSYYESCGSGSEPATTTAPETSSSCCDACAGSSSPFCSPQSGRCYSSKRKDYYEECASVTSTGASGTSSTVQQSTTTTTTTTTSSSTEEPASTSPSTCCQNCPFKPYCSPNSGNCYRSKNKDYYETCPVTPCEGADCPIGYSETDDKSGRGRWCEVGKAPAEWLPLKTCPAGTGKMTVKVLAYNLFWWNLFQRRGGENGRAGRKIASTSGPEEYDFMGFQECDDVSRVMRDAKRAGLSGDYGTVNGGRALAIAYRKSRWTLISSGAEDVGEDDRSQYYGRRTAHWARFRHRDGRTAFVANHHGPLPVSRSGGCTGSATSYNILRMIGENAYKSDAVFLVGDFNAASWSSRGKALDKHMHRIFSGTSHGGVDHIYSNCGGEEHVVESANLGSGGSDHDAIMSVFTIPKELQELSLTA